MVCDALPSVQYECGGVNLFVHTVRLVNDARQPPTAASSPNKLDSLAVQTSPRVDGI